MKRILFCFSLLTLSILAACNGSTLSFSEIANVPDDVQDKIESNYTLQLIGGGEDIYTSYIVYRTAGKVTTDLEVQGDTVKVKLDETNLQDDVSKPHVYKLTVDPEHEVIEVLINGQLTPFDNLTDF
ncbi:peptidylprolyl isomerase [Domibacillus sp. A3M-37]|uniref:peptidylprolyl isomerase n=1 Tax=Domibacillus sp. A3M-37 TaxID=2962037 RepID=UPI0020B682F9|nr:peptidylprolyl isomerase [Domibacillus sp. A3M-37]MCP3765019.1 peptidylprolyl isomerase [Domibacillus sp. A3M-37]